MLNERIFCMGVTPNRPDVGYGYIETENFGENLPKRKDHLAVKRFTEKPDLKTAKEYLKTKRFLWNSGIFIFKSKLFLEELKTHALRYMSLPSSR